MDCKINWKHEWYLIKHALVYVFWTGVILMGIISFCVGGSWVMNTFI